MPAVQICSLLSATIQTTCSTNAFPHTPNMLRLTMYVCTSAYVNTCTHKHLALGTSVFPHNNGEMSVNLQTLLYFYCCSGTPVNAAWSGPAGFSAHWPFICLHSPPFLRCIFPLPFVCKCVGVCLCLRTNTYVWVCGHCITVCFSQLTRHYV